MKNTFIVLLMITSVALGSLCLVQARKGSRQQTQLAALRGELEVKSQQLEALQAAKEGADRRRQELASQAEELAAQLRARELAATNVAAAPAPTVPPPAAETEKPDGEQAGFGKMLSKMMKDPDTRKFVRDQQRMMMDQLYAPLVKKMGLTPDEAAKFKDLLADNQMKGAEKAFSALEGLAATNRTEAISALNEDQKAFDEQVRAFLGDERYALYKDYQETAAERMQLNAFRLQAGSDYNLTEPQTEAMLKFMKEEQKNVSATTGLPLGDGTKDAATMQTLLADENFDRLLQAHETVGQRVYERARTILSPDQLAAWGRFQTNQLQTMRMGLSMAKKMFAPANPAAGATAPGQ